MKPPDDLGFVHVFVPADQPSRDGVTLLLLHGTGGDERDLLPLGRELWPGAALLGMRGNVLENGMPRFFRRFAEGVFDFDDLKARTNVLAQFIDAAAERYRFSKRHLVAVGYSNGANIAASLIFLHPHYLAASALFRAQVTFTPDLIRNFSGLSVFIGAGDRDPIVQARPPESRIARRSCALLRAAHVRYGRLGADRQRGRGDGQHWACECADHHDLPAPRA